MYPTISFALGGKTITIETGRFGVQASGAVTVRCGDTVVFASCVASHSIKEGIDYFPLSVDYQEKLYAGGVISSSKYIKREGRPSENEILTGRVIDRSIRPLFDQASRNEVQVIAYPLSIDGENEPEILSVIAASAAISLSHYPWNGPVGAVRLGMSPAGDIIVNPTNTEKSTSKLDLVVSGPAGKISMVESGAEEVSEEDMARALASADEQIATIIKAIEEISEKTGKQKITLAPTIISDIAKEIVDKEITNIDEILVNEAKKEGIQMAEVIRALAEKYPDVSKNEIAAYADEKLREIARKQILDTNKRADGRGVEDIRKINIEVGIIPRTHGSGFFQRGLTHVLSIVTLASPAREQLVDGMKGEISKRYMHHYNMPSFASGETGRMGTGRREIGHGALAERALVPVLPSATDFPYTIRVVSEVMSSNGSTSQASVCGSTLSLMDSGVPLKRPVAGIAMGLITEGDKYVTLTDISGLEDHLGDMDFKVAGTTEGITALQMDVKLTGIPAKILIEALDQAKRARLKLLELMTAVITEPRADLSPFAPRIISIQVPTEKIGEVIGSGGKTIRQIQSDFEVEVDINDAGVCTITGVDAVKVAGAKSFVESLIIEAEPGKAYEGVVVRLEAFGAFVNILPGKDGLVHVSQVNPETFRAMKIGDKVSVRCTEIDSMGRINLTMLAEGEAPIRAERPMGGGRPGGFGGGDRGPRRDGQGGRPGGRPNFTRFRDSR